MKKHIVLSIFGGIAIVGLLVALVGFFLGGRPGLFHVSDGRMVYSAMGDEPVTVGTAPPWMRMYGGWGRNGWRNNAATSIDTPAVSRPQRPSVSAAGVPFVPAGAMGLEVDIAAGYLVIQAGDEIGLTVDGPMPYKSELDGDTWKLETVDEHELFRFWEGRFWRGEIDMTTTFTLTLPANLNELDVSIDLGEANITGFTLRELDCQTDLGSITVANTKAANADFSVNLGGIDISGFEGDSCELNCDLGSIHFSGLVRNALDADCELGSISARMPTPASYRGQVEASLGSITVNGQSRGSGNFSDSFPTSAHGHSPTLELECGLGSIDVIFE